MTQTFNCPSCGAPLEPEGEKTTIVCKYCSESVVVPENLRDPPKPPTRPSYQPVNPIVDINSSKSYKNTTRGIIIFVVVVVVASVILPIIFSVFPLLIGLAAVWGIFSSSGSSTSNSAPILESIGKPNVRLERPVVFSPDGDTLSPDFMALIQDNNTDMYQYAMVDGKTQKILWKTDDLGKKGSDAKAYFYDSQVFVINDSTLTDFDRVSGKVLWEVALNNGLGNCKTCLVLVGNTVMVLQKDGSIQAVDVLSGKATWHKTLNSNHYDIFLANGQPAVQDNDQNNKEIIYILDPLTGKINQQLQPGCPAKKPDYTFSGSELAADGKSMVVFYENCLQTIRLPDGKVLTEVIGPKDNIGESAWPLAWFATKYLLAGDSIFYTMEGSQNPLNMLSLTKGSPKQLIADKKYALIPKFTIGDLLVIEAHPSFDSNQVEYWGVNTSNGQRMWTYALKGKGELDFHDIHALSNGIFSIQCRRDPDGCSWANVDINSGVGSNPGSVSSGGFVEPAWYKDTLYLGNEGELMVINGQNGKQLFQWP